MDLRKKLGPLPLWAWILIAGTAAGLLWYEHDKSSSSSSSTTNTSDTVDPATGLTYAAEAQEEAEGIDPYTGQTYAAEGTSSGDGTQYGDGGGGDWQGGTGITDPSTTSTPETFGQELSDVTGAITALQQAGLVTTPATQPTAAAAATTPGPNSASSSTASDVVKKLAGGVEIVNSKSAPLPAGDVLTGIGNGLYKIEPKTAVTVATKTSGSTSTKKTSTTKSKK